MSYLFQSRLFDDSGALQVVLADTIPLLAPRYEEWAADTEGRSYVTYAPATLPITAQRRRILGFGNVSLAFNTTGALYVTDGNAKSSSDETHDGIRIRNDGVLYIKAVSSAAVPVITKGRLSTDNTGATLVAGLALLLNFADLGSGVADTATSLGTAAPTFTRATAGAAKLSTGLWKLDVASGSPRYSYAGLDTTVTTTGGYLAEGARTNSGLQARDLTNASWTKTTMTTAKTSVGIDGAVNSCTRCTASAGNATALQAVTLASAAKAFGVWIKRVTGTGEIDITLDNGSTWTNITSQINASTFTLVQATQTLANPTIGIRIVTNADAIDVDVAQLEDGASFTSSPIPTTVASVTRNADELSYPTPSGFDTAGTVFAQFFPTNRTGAAGNWRISNGTATLDSNTALFVSNTQVGGFDGTNTPVVNNTSVASIKAAMAWGGTASIACADGTLGAGASYDGAWNYTVFGVGTGASATGHFFGPISRTAYTNYRVKDTNLTTMTTA